MVSGTRGRRSRRRCRTKAATACAVLLTVLALSSWTRMARPPEERPELSGSELGYLCNVATYSPGQAQSICEDYPELTEREKAAMWEIELATPGMTSALMEAYREARYGE